MGQGEFLAGVRTTLRLHQVLSLRINKAKVAVTGGCRVFAFPEFIIMHRRWKNKLHASWMLNGLLADTATIFPRRQDHYLVLEDIFGSISFRLWLQRQTTLCHSHIGHKLKFTEEWGIMHQQFCNTLPTFFLATVGHLDKEWTYQKFRGIRETVLGRCAKRRDLIWMLELLEHRGMLFGGL